MKNQIPNYCDHNEKEIKGFFGPYRFLSNFYSSPINFYGWEWPNVECGYQFGKLGGVYDEDQDWEYYDEIIKLKPGEVKKWGRSIKIHPDWEKNKYEVMTGLVFQKFYQNKDLRAQLLETGDAYLEETNAWHDLFFGVCAGSRKCDCSITNRNGENNLGKILMKVREFWK